jgi:methylmalonyl-CoA mutase N-terminal domain/subunit
MAIEVGVGPLDEELERWEKENQIGELPKVYTSAGIEIKPLYTPKDIEGLDYMRDLGLPGEYPFTRGIYPAMYRRKLWTMRQYSGFGTPRYTNQLWKWLLEEGQTGLSCAFDLPTQMGYDSDNEEFQDEVGTVGVAVDSLLDFEILFDGLPLDRLSTSFTINAITPIITAMYVAVAEKQGVPMDKVAGTVQNDILKEYIGRGAWIFPLEHSMRLIGDMFEFCSKYMPRFNPVSVCGYHIRESGANAVQEVGLCFLNACAYIENALARGLDIDSFVHRVTFNMASYMDLFEEVAKFRAARRIWASLIRHRYGAKKPSSWMWRWFAGTPGGTFTYRQPDNNIIRGTIEALATVLGGVQALTVNTKDEAYAIPTPEAQEIALRTQQIIAYESGVANTVDPLAGSYFVESLTNRMQEEIEKFMQHIWDRGGIIKSIEDGYVQRIVLEESYKRYKRIYETREQLVVGENIFVKEDEQPPMKLMRRDERVIEEQLESLRKVKSMRSQAAVDRALKELRRVAESGENIMPATLEAVKAYCTVGEMTAVLREVFGEFREPMNIF